ncbi:MAG TPA: hypothetical protein VM889_11805 [Candidatus Thermoplasmatota archaeon]|nr:hypothetical protein [Candidatus Thermoplasmatota archaeon]
MLMETKGRIKPMFSCIDEALDEAVRLLGERFGDVDQRAAVELTALLYSTRDRDRFMERDHAHDVPYST